LIVLGFLTAGQAEKLFCAKDPKFVVIDEVCGMCISLLWVPFSIETAIAAFFLFRLLDTLKPFPAARLEDRHGSLGIMGDDIVAGVYANGILQIALRFASFKTS
jgi:phosphatidylglycerophosphatase A